ncbi:hypothetical protein HDV57DRAFT_503720 [Trichoderma longibrachiatum]|uniref:Uncharacterized protein n=1 Tax=Trichoderma longibrachiatum ATCC 18648 TaxID=983965 RepID=A0A2T4BQV8_TRILO|nr:hypothetical protein M440DRAFT_1139692 [Trichoderma longibrachiatum ATCC 18648]
MSLWTLGRVGLSWFLGFFVFSFLVSPCFWLFSFVACCLVRFLAFVSLSFCQGSQPVLLLPLRLSSLYCSFLVDHDFGVLGELFSISFVLVHLQHFYRLIITFVGFIECSFCSFCFSVPVLFFAPVLAFVLSCLLLPSCLLILSYFLPLSCFLPCLGLCLALFFCSVSCVLLLCRSLPTVLCFPFLSLVRLSSFSVSPFSPWVWGLRVVLWLLEGVQCALFDPFPGL